MAALFVLFSLVLSGLSGSGRAVEGKTHKQNASSEMCNERGVCAPHEPIIIILD